jgi:hypothetical protein
MASAAPSAAVPMLDTLRKMVDAVEGQAAAAMEQFVAGEGFSELLVRVTENVVAVSRISSDLWDLTLRNLRLAGRGDIDRLGGHLLRTEDKLEMLLQAFERQEAGPDRQ